MVRKYDVYGTPYLDTPYTQDEVREFPEAAGVVAGPPALLLVESGMWSRYAPDNRPGTSDSAHRGPPPAGEAAVVTGDAVLAAIAIGR